MFKKFLSLLIICLLFMPDAALAIKYKGDLESNESLTLPEQGSTPANPSATKYKLYFKNDGEAYKLNSSGAEGRVGFTDAIVDGDISEAEGFLRKTGAGAYEGIKSNLGATVDPTINEDSGDGYAVGSIWINTTGDRVFQATDVTVAAAVWKELSTGGGGGMVLLGTATASASATIEFIDGTGGVVFDGTYELYRVNIINAIPATDDQSMMLRVRDTTFQSDVGDYSWGNSGMRETDPFDSGSTSDTKITLDENVATVKPGSAANESFSATVYVVNPAETALHKMVYFHSSYKSANAQHAGAAGAGMYKGSANAIDGLQFLFESGNITSGVFKLYGIN